MNLKDYTESIISSSEEIGGRMETLLSDISRFKEGIRGGIKARPTVSRIASWHPVAKKGHAACQDSVQYIPKLTRLLPTSEEVLSNPVIVSADSLSGAIFFTSQDLTVLSDSTVSITVEKDSRLESALETCTHRLPVAICLGAHPALALIAAFPLPERINPYTAAGFLKNGHFNLIPCFTQELNIPEECEIVIEGYIQKSDESRTFHASCLTHRKNASYSQENVDLTPAIEKLTVQFLKLTSLPQIQDIHLPEGPQDICTVKIAEHPGRSVESIANTLWGIEILRNCKSLKIVSESPEKGCTIVQRCGEKERICYF